MNEQVSPHIIRRSSIPQMLKWSVDARVVSVFWASFAVLLTLTGQLIMLDRPFQYDHDWVSAHFSTMARSFVDHGVIALRGVPIQNNPPLGLDPDVYLHWPPLFPIVLSVTFQLFGESESVAHGLMLLILLANGLALFALVNICYGRGAGLFALFAALAMPVTVTYGSLVLHLHMGIFFMLLALLAFLKATLVARVHTGWASFGVLAVALSVLTSWEPLLMGLALLGLAIWQRHQPRIRLALLYCGIGLFVFIAVMGVYLSNSPDLFNDLWHTVLYRTGLVSFNASTFHIHTVTNDELYTTVGQPSLVNKLKWFARELVTHIGPLPIIALGWILSIGWLSGKSESNERSAALFVGLMVPWLSWFVIMSNHAYAHEYQILLAMPAASAAFGVAIVTLPPDIRRFTVLIVAPLVMLLPLTLEVKNRIIDDKHRENSLITYARHIKDNTEPTAVVMIPDNSMVPVYYSKRHMIRGVANDSIVTKVGQELSHLFPGSPVYLALHPDDTREFLQSLQGYQLVKQSKQLTLLRLPALNMSRSAPSID
ncbi:MAG TPA: glycosyltransferase family 39 protein [Ktedonobacteraceae bacterium]